MNSTEKLTNQELLKVLDEIEDEIDEIHQYERDQKSLSDRINNLSEISLGMCSAIYVELSCNRTQKIDIKDTARAKELISQIVTSEIAVAKEDLKQCAEKIDILLDDIRKKWGEI